MNNVATARRIQGIGEYYFSRKLKQIAELSVKMEVLNLGIGSPDMAPHPSVIQSFNEAILEQGAHQYQSYRGLPELRVAIADWYKRFFGCHLDAETEVLPLIGSKEGITHISMSLLDEGNQVLVPNPGYPAYEAASKMAGAEVVHYDLIEENGYYPNFAQLENMDLRKVKIMWVNYPHMPTGTPGGEDFFEQLIGFCKSNDIILINDNPYAFILTDAPISILAGRSESDYVLELNSLSKSHNMAGWRIGMLAGNKELIDTVLTFKSQVDSGQFKPMLKAAVEALNLDNHWFLQLNEEYKKRKMWAKRLVDLLGCQCDPRKVGMFLWAKIPKYVSDAEAFSDMILEKYNLFIPPGSIFGSNGNRHIRLSLCSPEHVWMKAINRLNETK